MFSRPRMPRVQRSPLVLILAVTALAFPLGVLATHQFSDVPTGASFHDDVEALVDHGITTGCGGGEYCPGDPVTRGNMAQFLNRIGNLDGNTPPSVDADMVDGLDSEHFLLSAVVNADGSLARGVGAASVSTSGTGNKIVIFDRNVRDCTYTASVGLSGASGTSAAGFITVVGAAIDENGVFVTTDDILGASTDLGFHLHLTCPNPALTLVEAGPIVSGTDGANQR
jgi:hypothetical protein